MNPLFLAELCLVFGRMLASCFRALAVILVSDLSIQKTKTKTKTKQIRTDPKCPQENEGDEFLEGPLLIVVNVEHHEVVVAERIDGAQDERGDEGAEERPPQRLERKVVTDLANGRFKVVKHVSHASLWARFNTSQSRGI